MAEEKQEDKELPTEDGSDEELSEEKSLPEDGSDDSQGTDEETISISKRELEVLKKKAEDGENYKKAFTEKKEFKKAGLDPTGYVTKAEFYAEKEREAIKEACKDDYFDKRWNEIIKYYVPRRGKASVEGILDDLKDARILHDAYAGSDGNAKEVDSDIKRKLANEKSMPGGGGLKGQEVKKGGVIRKSEPIQNWYKTEDK